MARYLQLDKKQYGNSGLIPLRRGDNWTLLGQVVTKYPRVTEEFDLTSCSATAFFEASTGGNVVRDVTITNETCGKVEIDVPATGENNSSEVALAESGTTMYLTLEHPTLGLITVETEFPALEIKDRGYTES